MNKLYEMAVVSVLKTVYFYFSSLASVVASLIDCVTKESLTPEKQLEVERYGNWTLRELANLISLKVSKLWKSGNT